MKVRGKKVAARRTAWELYYGPIPEEMGVYRWCLRYKDCVNPNHLFLSKCGDWKDNYLLQFEDKVHLSRFITLSEEEVYKLRQLNTKEVLTRRELSSQFRISLKQVDWILDGRPVCHKTYWFEPGEGSVYYGLEKALKKVREVA